MQFGKKISERQFPNNVKISWKNKPTWLSWEVTARYS